MAEKAAHRRILRNVSENLLNTEMLLLLSFNFGNYGDFGNFGNSCGLSAIC